jgi:hypothetical protein
VRFIQFAHFKFGILILSGILQLPIVVKGTPIKPGAAVESRGKRNL